MCDICFLLQQAEEASDWAHWWCCVKDVQCCWIILVLQHSLHNQLQGIQGSPKYRASLFISLYSFFESLALLLLPQQVTKQIPLSTTFGRNVTSCWKQWRIKVSSRSAVCSIRVAFPVQSVDQVNTQVNAVLLHHFHLHLLSQNRIWLITCHKSPVMSLVLFIFKMRGLFPHHATSLSSITDTPHNCRVLLAFLKMTGLWVVLEVWSVQNEEKLWVYNPLCSSCAFDHLFRHNPSVSQTAVCLSGSRYSSWLWRHSLLHSRA